MTSSLIVNCYLNPPKINRLVRAIKRFSECVTVQFRDLNAGYKVGKNIDAVVISGSEARIVNPSHIDMFKGTTDFIRNLRLPTLGICYGHQLVCRSLGAGVASLAQPVQDRFEKIRIVEVDEIFVGFEKYQTLPLAQRHYDYVLSEGLGQVGLVLLADSPSCEVEAVKLEQSPFYGLQFHPERINIKGQSHLEGYKIIENFYRNVVKR